MKQPKEESPGDPAAMIAAALKKRFARLHSPGSEVSDSDDELKNDKENSYIVQDDEDFSDVSPPKPSILKRRRIFENNKQTSGGGIRTKRLNNVRKRAEPLSLDNRVNFPETY